MQNVFSDVRVRTGRVKEANPQFHCGFVRSAVGWLFVFGLVFSKLGNEWEQKLRQ